MTQKPYVVELLILIMFSPANGHSFDNSLMELIMDTHELIMDTHKLYSERG